MIKKGVVAALVALYMGLWCVPALAASGITPSEFNPVCWKEDECNKAREVFLKKSGEILTDDEKKMVSNGFVADPSVCPGDGWGKCLPANVTITAISIAGQNRFLHIGDYIQTVYKFILSIATILAAAMLVIAGVQWVTSGGNAESISTAKHRITNALVGMFLAYTSFFILNTINPDLINLRLPQVYLIKPQNAVPAQCSAAPSTTVFAEVAVDQKSKIDTSKAPDFDKSGITYNQMLTTSKGECGHRFLMQDGGPNACFGSFCPQGKGCVNVNLQTGLDADYSCQAASVYGTVYDTNFLSNPDNDIFTRCMQAAFQPGYKFPYAEDAAIMEVCDTHEMTNHYVLKNTEVTEHLVPNNKANRLFFYMDPVSDLSSTKCTNGTSMGYILWLSLKGACRVADAAVVGRNAQIVGKADTNSGDWVIDTQTPLSSSATGTIFTAQEIKNGQRLDINVSNIQL